MAKRRTREPKQPVVVNCAKKKCECKEKITLDKKTLDDGRITKNEIVEQLNEAQKQCKVYKDLLSVKENFIKEQDTIISDLFDDLVESRDSIDGLRMGRNISIIINVILIIVLILFVC